MYKILKNKMYNHGPHYCRSNVHHANVVVLSAQDIDEQDNEAWR